MEDEKARQEKGEEAEEDKQQQKQQVVKRRTLLVVGGKANVAWPAVFEGATLHAGLVDVAVGMASWDGTFFLFYF
jgi:hypothetical protein